MGLFARKIPRYLVKIPRQLGKICCLGIFICCLSVCATYVFDVKNIVCHASLTYRREIFETPKINNRNRLLQHFQMLLEECGYK